MAYADTENHHRITEIVKAARMCGLSYGQYVQKTGGKVPPPEELMLPINPKAKRCRLCGMPFIPNGPAQKFCSPSCRKQEYTILHKNG